MTKDETKQAIEGFAQFFRAITGDQELEIPKDIKERFDIQEPNGGWIPVSERLPERGQRILISQTTEYGHRIEIDHYDRWGFLMGKVDAWMPLPKPYKPQERSE